MSRTRLCACDARADTLNLVAHENDGVRRASAALAAEPPHVTLDAIEAAARRGGPVGSARVLAMPRRHELLPELDVATPYLEKILVRS